MALTNGAASPLVKEKKQKEQRTKKQITKTNYRIN